MQTKYINGLGLNQDFDEKGFSVDAKDGRVFRYYTSAVELELLQALKRASLETLNFESEYDSRGFRRPETIPLKEDKSKYIIPINNRDKDLHLDFIKPKPLSLQDMLLDLNANSVLQLAREDRNHEDLSIVCKYNPQKNTLTALDLHQRSRPTLASKFIPDFYLNNGQKLKLAQNVCDKAVNELDIKGAYEMYQAQLRAYLDPALRTLLKYQ